MQIILSKITKLNLVAVNLINLNYTLERYFIGSCFYIFGNLNKINPMKIEGYLENKISFTLPCSHKEFRD